MAGCHVHAAMAEVELNGANHVFIGEEEIEERNGNTFWTRACWNAGIYCNRFKELVGGTAEKRNWRGIIISLLVILLILALIVVAIIISYPDFHVYNKYTFEDIFDPQYEPRYYDAVWLTENEYVLRDSTNNVVLLDASGVAPPSVLLSNRTMDEEGITRFWVKPDKEYILVSTQEKQLYRHSFEAVYKIFQISTQTMTLVNPPGESGPVVLRYAAWAPQGSGLAFVYKNNLYYQSAPSNAPEAVTQDGVEGEIFNGIPDWVYEEEILSSGNAVYWYEDGSALVFGSFNDSHVAKAWFPVYDNKVYSEIKYINYPKAGYPNPHFTLYVMAIDDISSLVALKPPTQFQDQDYYYSNVVWKDRYQVTVMWLNRAQNVSLMTICQVDSGICNVNYEMQTTNGWIVQQDDVIFAEDGQSYFTLQPWKDIEGAKGNFFHIARITSESGQMGEVSLLTEGMWEVTKIVGYNIQLKMIYFISTTPNAPGNRTLYSLNVETKEKTCLMCDEFEDCFYFDAVFNKEASRYFLQCLGPLIPHTTLHSIDSSNYTMLEGNDDIREAYQDKDYVLKRYETVKSADGNYDVPVELLIPRNFDPARKHPLLVDVYGGPRSQMADSQFRQGWYAFLSSNYHVIIARIDGRGSGYKGDKMMYEVYKRLGTVEVEDQVEAVRSLHDSYSFLDWNKTAIWGWSYGGFASTLAAMSGMFNCTMSVAPVTDWRFYDTIYTERYMGMPTATDNLQGYKNSNVSARAGDLSHTNYLLVHGLADDNVHFQNSANLVKALVEAGIPHQLQYYTDENHALADQKVQENLYRILTDFLLRCLDTC